MLWVQILNRGLEWRDLESARAATWELEPGAQLSGASHARLGRDLGILRSAYVAAALGRPFEDQEACALREWLAAVTLRPSERTMLSGFELPALWAARDRSELPSLLEVLLSTSLVQLVGSGPQLQTVSRCRGPRRGPGLDLDPDDEAAFASQAGLEDLLARGCYQCPRLVDAPRQAQYCSKACSNAAFVWRKAQHQPGYFAAKQKRYRVRQQPAPPRPGGGAFMFLD